MNVTTTEISHPQTELEENSPDLSDLVRSKNFCDNFL